MGAEQLAEMTAALVSTYKRHEFRPTRFFVLSDVTDVSN